MKFNHKTLQKQDTSQNKPKQYEHYEKQSQNTTKQDTKQDKPKQQSMQQPLTRALPPTRPSTISSGSVPSSGRAPTQLAKKVSSLSSS